MVSILQLMLPKEAKAKQLNVSRTAVYDKLNGVETAVSAALVKESAGEMASLIELWRGSESGLLPGYRVRVLDGNCLAGTEHRLEILRSVRAKALPGKSLVVLDPDLQLAINVFPCEDGHAQERSLFQEVLETVDSGELWIADRNMCTRGFLLGLHKKGADFVIREHKSMPWEAVSELSPQGRLKTGTLFEQTVRITEKGDSLLMRRVVLNLFKATQNGEKEIAIFTALSPEKATTSDVTHFYRNRRTVENLFQTVTDNYKCEIETLGYPKAALFSFCLALVAYNILATVRAALATVHGAGKIEASLSDYYIVDEMQGTYRGMMIAIAPVYWQVFESFSLKQLAALLLDLAAGVHLKSFLKQPRSPKKKKRPPVYDPRHPHLSTARLLDQAQKSP